MANLGNFNANNVEPTTDFEPIPAGRYVAIITTSEMKPTKSGNGQYLELTFQIIDGPCKNRLLWSRLNLDNPGTQAVEIALGELSAICRAVGVMQPRDSAELHNIPLLVTVKCKTREDTGEVASEIRGYSKREAGSGGTTRQEATSIPPWARR